MVDAGETEHGGQQISVARERTDLPRRAVDHWTRDDEGDVHRLFVGVVPLLMHPAMRTEQVTVIGGEYHDCVVVCIGRPQSGEHALYLDIDGLL